MSDSTTAISCGFVVQQVVRLAVRLADCCMQLAVNLLCDKLSNLLYDSLSVVQLVVDFCCGSVVQLVVQHVVRQMYNRSKLMESDT